MYLDGAPGALVSLFADRALHEFAAFLAPSGPAGRGS